MQFIYISIYLIAFYYLAERSIPILVEMALSDWLIKIRSRAILTGMDRAALFEIRSSVALSLHVVRCLPARRSLMSHLFRLES